MSSAERWKSSTIPSPPARPADHRRRPLIVALAIGLGLATIPIDRSARAHDIPDERVDRAIQVRLDPPRLFVSYEVSLSEWTLYQDLKRLAPELGSGDRVDSYARLVAPLNARGLVTTVEGEDVPWSFDRVNLDYEEHPVLTFHFEATIPTAGHLRLIDTNYVSSYGTSRLALSVEPGTRQDGYDGPSHLEAVPEQPVWALSDEDEAATKQLAIAYGPDAHAVPAEPDRAIAEAPRSDTGPRASTTLTRLFWEPTGRTVPFLLLAAVVIGAAHAVQPGHGKTAVVGASIQGDRPIGRGLLLAGTAAGSHVLLAIGLAMVVVLVVPSGFEGIDRVLTRGVGLVLGIIGAWRIGSSVAGSTPAENEAGRRVESSRDAILAGVAIGAIPCWDAVLLLAIAWVAGEAMLGVALLVAFSLGASATLLGVALASGLFRTISGRLTESPRLERSLGTIGGLLLSGIGAYLFLS